jgi:hypothetical protein
MPDIGPAPGNNPPVGEEPTEGKFYAVSVSAPADGVAPNILFSLRPDTIAPDEYSTLHADIERTVTILKVLFFAKRKDKFREYFSRLVELARASLGQDQVRLGRLALIAFQNEIVTREAGWVKNSYIRRLGRWALLFGLCATIAYLFCRYWYPAWFGIPELHRFREFFSMLAGCFLGTWLSFSIRRVQLTFEDLARLEEDSLDPGVRLLFVAGLTVVVGLLLATKAFVITFGGFNSAFLDSGTTAVLIGCLCGIGELGLPAAVARRASEFVAVLGGGKAGDGSAAPVAEDIHRTGRQGDQNQTKQNEKSDQKDDKNKPA